MAMDVIEPGQRLRTQVGGQTRFVQVLAEAVVPAAYWLCRDEATGQSRVIAQTALLPVAVEPVVVGQEAGESLADESVAVESDEQMAVESDEQMAVESDEQMAVESLEQIESPPAIPSVMAAPAITAAA